MKVWFLLSRLDRGGLERVQVNLAQAFSKRGVDVKLVVGRIAPGAHNEVPPSIEILEIASTGRAYFLIGLLRALRREQPDVVFTTSNDVACLMVFFRLILFRRVRVFVTQHLSLLGAKKLTHGFDRIKFTITLWSMRLLVPRADHVIAVSQGVGKELLEVLRVDASRLDIIHNPILTPDFDASLQGVVNWPWPDNVLKTIIFVGRLEPVKRPDLLLDCFNELIRERPVRLLILGDGSLRVDIEKNIAINGLNDSVAVLGFVDNPIPFIQKSHVLVLPSDCEGFGNVLVEAMACGTQVVSSDCPHGPSEILDRGRFGQLVPMNDADALQLAVRKCLDGEFHVPEDELKAGAEKFRLDLIVERYLSLIASA